jgi:two-component sensor histidine kinase
MLRQSQNRVRTMALIHQTLYQSGDFAEVDFGRFLEALAPTLISSYGIDPERVALDIEAGDVHLPIQAAIPCGVLVNELISNSLKHAFREGRCGRIQVRLTRDRNDRVHLVVCDNGVGLPHTVNVDSADTLGLQLVTLLSEQVGAEMTMQRSDPTCFRLQFPVSR